MRQSQNLYEYLYQTLVSQFISGVYLPGQKFPSQREICLQYNMGITTVRKVMKMLDEQRYIRTAQGQPTVVTYQASTQTHIEILVQRREAIADAYRGLERIMPVLYREGAKRCKEPELRLLREIMSHVSDQMELAELYRQANVFFTTLLRPMKNQLMMDLELDSENYLHVPYIPIPSAEDPFALTADRLKTYLQNAIAQIEKKQFDAFCDGAVRFYRESGKRVDDYLCTLGRHIAVATPQKNQDIHWFRTKGRSELYARLAMTIIRRIAGGEFDEQKYLPSIPKLMDEYGVMKDTASRAVSLLNSLGAVQTIDKKGTVMIMEGTAVMKSGARLEDPMIQERLSLFLDALQIISLTVRSCAAAFSSVPESLASSVENRIRMTPGSRVSSLSVQLLMHCFIQLIPYHSLKNIFKQLDELMVWGYYLQSADESLYPASSGAFDAMNEVVAALKSQNHSGLPDAFEKVFALIYQEARSVISTMAGA